jgi:hypothetical protein
VWSYTFGIAVTAFNIWRENILPVGMIGYGVMDYLSCIFVMSFVKIV